MENRQNFKIHYFKCRGENLRFLISHEKILFIEFCDGHDLLGMPRWKQKDFSNIIKGADGGSCLVHNSEILDIINEAYKIGMISKKEADNAT